MSELMKSFTNPSGLAEALGMTAGTKLSFKLDLDVDLRQWGAGETSNSKNGARRKITKVTISEGKSGRTRLRIHVLWLDNKWSLTGEDLKEDMSWYRDHETIGNWFLFTQDSLDSLQTELIKLNNK